ASGNINTTGGIYQSQGLSGINLGPCSNNQYIGNGVRVSGGIIVGGDCRTVGLLSDIRLKENIVEIDSVIAGLKNLNIYEYDYRCNDPEFAELYLTCDHQIGVIAQELEAIFPELVFEEDGYKK